GARLPDIGPGEAAGGEEGVTVLEEKIGLGLGALRGLLSARIIRKHAGREKVGADLDAERNGVCVGDAFYGEELAALPEDGVELELHKMALGKLCRHEFI